MNLSHIHLAVLICQNIWATRHSNLAYYSRYVLDPLILWIVNTIDSISDANYVCKNRTINYVVQFFILKYVVWVEEKKKSKKVLNSIWCSMLKCKISLKLAEISHVQTSNKCQRIRMIFTV